VLRPVWSSAPSQVGVYVVPQFHQKTRPTYLSRASQRSLAPTYLPIQLGRPLQRQLRPCYVVTSFILWYESFSLAPQAPEKIGCGPTRALFFRARRLRFAAVCPHLFPISLRAFIGSRRRAASGSHRLARAFDRLLVSDVSRCLTVTSHRAVTFGSNCDLPTYPSPPKTCEKCTYLPIASAKRASTCTLSGREPRTWHEKELPSENRTLVHNVGFLAGYTTFSTAVLRCPE